jgi:hypothetical protein
MRSMLAAAALLILFWLPATSVPFWQDDYNFLLAARNARVATSATPWLTIFQPDPGQQLWRPIGVGLWWRFIEGPLGGNARFAHVAGILLLVLASAAVGWLVVTIDELAPGLINLKTGDANGRPISWATRGSLAAFLYGIHGSHFLPVAWTSAANDSMALLFGALALRFWIFGVVSQRTASLAASVVLFVLALLSRESAVVLPILGLLLMMWIRPQPRPSRLTLAFGSAALVTAIGWLLLHGTWAAAPAPAYAFHFGSNILRNLASLAYFALNGPREALRFMMLQPSAMVGFWGAACVVTQLAAFLTLARLASPSLGRRRLGILFVFMALACAPYVLVAGNSYEYYVSCALIAYALLASIGSRWSRPMSVAIVLAFMSSALFVAGSYRLGYPALIARAQWGERQLRLLESWQAQQPGLLAGRVFVRIDDAQKFQAFGAAGLAYRLGLDPANIVGLHPDDPAPAGSVVIVVPASGDVHVSR